MDHGNGRRGGVDVVDVVDRCVLGWISRPGPTEERERKKPFLVRKNWSSSTGTVVSVAAAAPYSINKPAAGLL